MTTVKMPGMRRSRYGRCPNCDKRGLRLEKRLGGGNTLAYGSITCRYCHVIETVQDGRRIKAAVKRLQDRFMQPYEFHVYGPDNRMPSYATTRLTVNPMRLAARAVRWINYICGLPGGVDVAVSRIRVYRIEGNGVEYVGERQHRRRAVRERCPQCDHRYVAPGLPWCNVCSRRHSRAVEEAYEDRKEK